MGVEVDWRSKQGTHTDDNRDYCGVGLRDDAALCVVLDGSTSGANSGEFSQVIARDLIDWFMTVRSVTVEAVISRLRCIHSDLLPRFRRDSASFVIALINDEGAAQVLHVGDCLAGLHEGTSAVKWWTRPHTLANAVNELRITDIARSPLRNRLIRSFRSREFMTPDVSGLVVDGEQTLVLATDGFWAELDPESQARFLAGEKLSEIEGYGQDDCSALSLKHVNSSESKVSDEVSDNIYIVDAFAS